ncbi:MAG: glycosyltransferase family 4 protein [Ignavibacteria bacterium]
MPNIVSPKNKIKILETIRQGNIGGGESHVLDLVLNLNKEVFEPVILSFTDGPMVEKLRSANIKTYVVHTEKPFDKGVRGKVGEIFDNEKFDLIHAHGTRALSNTYYIAEKRKVPIIYTVHGWSFHPDQNFLVKKLRIISERFLIKRTDLTIVVSEANMREGIKYCGMKRYKLVHNGINLDKFNPDKNYPDLKEELGIPAGKTTAAFIVRMTKQKDPFTVIKAAAITAKKSNEVYFLMIGDGDLKEDAIKLAKELGLDETMIRFHKFMQDVPSVLNTIDIYVLPSLWEGLPIGLIEAMGMRKAVIATPADGTKEVIRNGENGLLVPFENPQALSEAIISFHNDEKLRKKCESNGRISVERDFELHKMIKTIEEIYLNIYKKEWVL